MIRRRTGRRHNAFAFGRYLRKGEFVHRFGVPAWQAIPKAKILKDGRRQAVAYTTVVEQQGGL